MPLSSEDSLRLNVLLAQSVKAIRIDEGKMILYALTDKGQAKIVLSPNVRAAHYIKEVKDFLSNKVLGISGGFPVYISHWNRLGQAKGENLEKLLLLAEETAVIAVVNSADITPELAASAWWALQHPDHARSMLARPQIVNSDIGKELAKFLLEFLPFEEKPANMLQSARLVLQADLISVEEKQKLWQKARNKNTLYLGFMDATPNDMPQQQPPHANCEQIQPQIKALISQNTLANSLYYLLNSKGQTFLHTAQSAFKRPPDQNVYCALLDSLHRYVNDPQNTGQGQYLYNYSPGLHNQIETGQNIHQIATDVTQMMQKATQFNTESTQNTQMIHEILQKNPDLYPLVEAILVLSRVSQAVTFPVFSKTTAQGSLMRKKLKPVTDFVLQRIRVLQTAI